MATTISTVNIRLYVADPVHFVEYTNGQYSLILGDTAHTPLSGLNVIQICQLHNYFKQWSRKSFSLFHIKMLHHILITEAL